MRRIEKGPVRGISFKLQEEERERKDNYVPETSAIESELIEVDADTKDMLRSIGFGNLAGVQQVPLSQLGRDSGRDAPYRNRDNRESKQKKARDDWEENGVYARCVVSKEKTSFVQTPHVLSLFLGRAKRMTIIIILLIIMPVPTRKERLVE